MVSYNKGRFIFIFDSGTRRLFAIHDSKYEKSYPVSNYEFSTVFGVAIESLDNSALEELKEKVGNETKYGFAIAKILESRSKSTE